MTNDIIIIITTHEMFRAPGRHAARSVVKSSTWTKYVLSSLCYVMLCSCLVMYCCCVMYISCACVSSIWKNGPSPWEIRTFEGHLEAHISNGSGILDPSMLVLANRHQEN